MRNAVVLRRLSSILAVLFLSGCNPNMPGTPAVPLEDVRVTLQSIAGGFTSPVGLVSPPDGTDRLFVVDQVGRVFIVEPGAAVRSEPFLDVSDRMVPLMSGFDERGLLSIAFHPQYASSGRFFAVYNAPLAPGDDPQFNSRWRLSEFRVSAGDPNRADAASEVVLLEVLKPQFNHNGGQLAFGPDDMLYASIGDGGGANDTGFGHTPDIGNAQDLTNLLGGILRLDVSTPGVLAIPEDNPFAGDAGAEDAIYANGLRNPWRFSFDSATGRLFCADAGQNLSEEVNLIESGGNYGWAIREGSHCFSPDSPSEPPANCATVGSRGEPLANPIIEYSHLDASGEPVRLVVVGGYVYRGTEVPNLSGRYVFADWSSSFTEPDGTLYLAEESTSGTWRFIELADAADEDGRLNRYILAFGQDQRGEVYVLTSRNAGPTGLTGEVLKLIDSP